MYCKRELARRTLYTIHLSPAFSSSLGPKLNNSVILVQHWHTLRAVAKESLTENYWERKGHYPLLWSDFKNEKLRGDDFISLHGHLYHSFTPKCPMGILCIMNCSHFRSDTWKQAEMKTNTCAEMYCVWFLLPPSHRLRWRHMNCNVSWFGGGMLSTRHFRRSTLSM